MQIINITEARKKLPELINRAYLESESFLITKGGIPMVEVKKADKSIKRTRMKANVTRAIKLANSIDWIWNDKKWKNKSTVEIVNYLREKAWNSHAS